MKNENEIRKAYVAPEMSVVQLKTQGKLLQSSECGEGCGFGLNYENSDIEHV